MLSPAVPRQPLRHVRGPFNIILPERGRGREKSMRRESFLSTAAENHIGLAKQGTFQALYGTMKPGPAWDREWGRPGIAFSLEEPGEPADVQVSPQHLWLSLPASPCPVVARNRSPDPKNPSRVPIATCRDAASPRNSGAVCTCPRPGQDTTVGLPYSNQL